MRRADWVERLLATIEECKSEPFAYGGLDCVRFSARCADSILEESTWEEQLAAIYIDRFSAFRVLLAEGGLEAAVTKRLGEPVRPLQARRGDICLVPTEAEGGVALGVCVGAEIMVLVPEKSIDAVPLDSALKAWRID